MKKFKRIIRILIIAVICFVGLLLFNNFQFTSKQIDVPLIAPIKIDKAAIRHFAEAITIKTVSPENPKDFDSLAFYKFNRFLKQNYPFADSLLNKKTFNSFSHLYYWDGTDPSLKPIILMAHLDVVPVIKENLPDWKHPPFKYDEIIDWNKRMNLAKSFFSTNDFEKKKIILVEINNLEKVSHVLMIKKKLNSDCENLIDDEKYLLVRAEDCF